MDLQTIKTKSGKTIQDFTIPEKFLKSDQELVDLIMQSESMDDGEKQYWFNLSEVMTAEQIEKLRDILVRERKKLAEIDERYMQKQKEEKESFARAQEKGAQWSEARKELTEREKVSEAKEKKEEENVLAELENL